MALYTRKEWAKKCGVSPTNMSNFIKHGKVISRPDKRIDSNDEQNVLFLETRISRGEAPQPRGQKGVKHSEEFKGVTPAAQAKKKSEMLSLEEQRRKAELRKMEIEEQMQNAKLKRMSGELIPFETVKVAFRTHFESHTKAFKDMIDGMLSELAKKFRLNRNDIADLKHTMLKGLNRANEDAIETSKRSIQAIVSDYSKRK